MSNDALSSQPLPDDWRKQAASGHRQDGSLVAARCMYIPRWLLPAYGPHRPISPSSRLTCNSHSPAGQTRCSARAGGNDDNCLYENVVWAFSSRKHGNALYFGHGGADEGFRAEMLVSKDKGYGAVVMTNSGEQRQILREVLRGVAREYGWDEFLPAPYETIALEASKVNDYVGRYQVNPDLVLTIKNEGGKLVASPTGDREFELLPISDTTFIRRDSNNKYNFVRSEGGGAADEGDPAAKSAGNFSCCPDSNLRHH